MRRLFSIGGPVYGILSVVLELVILNAAFIVGSLPVVTVGTSAIALYDGVAAVRRGTFTLRRFLSVYRSHLLLGFELEGIVVALFSLLAIMLWLTSGMGLFGRSMNLLFCLISAVLVLSIPYLFTIPSLHVLGPVATLKAAVSQCLRHVGLSIVTALVSIMLMAVPVLAWRLFFIWLFIVFSTVAWVQSVLLHRIMVAPAQLSSECQSGKMGER